MAVKMFAPNYHDIPLFKGLGRDEINEVLHKFHGLIKHFPKSDYIYLAGDCIENLCVVMEGTVQMIKEDIWGEKSIIANLSAGDVFAENYLGKLSDRSVVSYFAASDSEILMLPLGRMLFDGSNHNETNRRLMCNIVSILADNNTRLIEKTEILRLDPFLKMGKPQKIASYFGGKDGYLKAVKELEQAIYEGEIA